MCGWNKCSQWTHYVKESWDKIFIAEQKRSYGSLSSVSQNLVSDRFLLAQEYSALKIQHLGNRYSLTAFKVYWKFKYICLRTMGGDYKCVAKMTTS